MGKKVVDKVLFVLVIAAAILFTWFVSGGVLDTMIFNFVFLGIMVLISLAVMIV